MSPDELAERIRAAHRAAMTADAFGTICARVFIKRRDEVLQLINQARATIGDGPGLFAAWIASLPPDVADIITTRGRAAPLAPF